MDTFGLTSTPCIVPSDGTSFDVTAEVDISLSGLVNTFFALLYRKKMCNTFRHFAVRVLTHYCSASQTWNDTLHRVLLRLQESYELHTFCSPHQAIPGQISKALSKPSAYAKEARQPSANFYTTESAKMPTSEPTTLPISCWQELLVIVALCLYSTISFAVIGTILPWSEHVDDPVNFLKYLTISGATMVPLLGLISIEMLSRIFVFEVIMAHAKGIRPWCEENPEELRKMHGGILPKYSRISYAFKKKFGYQRKVEKDEVDDAMNAEKGVLDYMTIKEI